MNTMVLSDYGMTASEGLSEIELDDYIDLELIQYVIVSAGYAIIVPYVLDHRHILDSLQSIPDGVDVYLASQLQVAYTTNDDFYLNRLPPCLSSLVCPFDSVPEGL